MRMNKIYMFIIMWIFVGSFVCLSKKSHFGLNNLLIFSLLPSHSHDHLVRKLSIVLETAVPPSSPLPPKFRECSLWSWHFNQFIWYGIIHITFPIGALSYNLIPNHKCIKRGKFMVKIKITIACCKLHNHIMGFAKR